MEQTIQSITKSVMISALALVCLAFGLGGVEVGKGALIGGLMATANWMAIAWIGKRLMTLSEKAKAAVGLLLVVKMGAVLVASWLLLRTGLVDPTGYMVGLSALVLGVTLGAFRAASSRKDLAGESHAGS
jgi:hypothetical protein